MIPGTELYARPAIDTPSSREVRTPGQRDADRILYSSAFRRLTGVTQVISPQDDYIFHDRSMHSFKVGQVAQRLSQKLMQEYPSANLDSDVTYAAALAHDLGHPPFGHAAESELQRILDGKIGRDGRSINGIPILRDSFEGNAQSFRIVARLAVRKKLERKAFEDGREGKVGLNLTWRTYAAILKYPWRRGKADQPGLDHKWGAFDPERDVLEQASEVAKRYGVWPEAGTRSLEAEIMDWADDVAYAVHDTEDFFRAKLIPLDRLLSEKLLIGVPNRRSEWVELVDEVEDKVFAVVAKLGRDGDWSHERYLAFCDECCDLFPNNEYHGDTDTRERLHAFASEMISNLTESVTISNGCLEVPTRAIIQAEFLKKLTRNFVIDRADLRFDQLGQCQLIRHLFFDLYDLARSAWIGGDLDAQRSMPSRLREYCDDSLLPDMDVYGTDDARLARAVVDFICSLTDRQAAILARRLSGDVLSTSVSWVSV